MPTIKPELTRYVPPDFLAGRCDKAVYYKWLKVKANTLLKRDRKRGKPYALAVNQSVYMNKIHEAVIQCGAYDPYTGDYLAWEQIGTWDTSAPHPDGYKRAFALMPTVDHIDPNALEFEICSWMSNDCKSDLLPDELIEFCTKVTKYRGK